MEAIVLHPPLNASQLFVLKTLASARSEQEKEELTSLYLDYIQQKLTQTTVSEPVEPLRFGHRKKKEQSF